MMSPTSGLISAVFFLLFGVGIPYGNAAADKAEYELQERCGRRAAEMFEKEYGTGSATTDTGYRITSYSNNYSVTFNKCFMRIQTTEHGREKPGANPPTFDLVSLELRDVNANKSIGYCSYFKGRLPKQENCIFGGENVASPRIWESLLEPYME